MGHPTKKTKEHEAPVDISTTHSASVLPACVVEAGESDDEYEDVPALRAQGTSHKLLQAEAAPVAAAEDRISAPDPPAELARDVPQLSADATDDDWLRSRTSRLLDLVDPDDPKFFTRPPPSAPAATPAVVPSSAPPDDDSADATGRGDGTPAQPENAQDAVKSVEKTRRLFLRNLSYKVTEDDIRDHFSKFGTLEEVGISHFLCIPCCPLFMMNP